MQLILNRKWKTQDSIEGELSIDGQFFCLTLERRDDLHIPVGSYKVEFTYSPKFKRVMPLVLVPGRDGIRFHSGSKASDSEGCILLGDGLVSPGVISGGLINHVVEKFEKRLLDQSNITLTVAENWE